MKKKLLPFILGCAMVAAMPLAAHATPDVEYANEIPTGQTSPTEGDESQNGFTEYNDTETTENTLAKVFDNSTSTGSGLGNTRNTTSTMQTAYPVTLQNEKQGYRATAHTLEQDIADDNTAFAEQTNDTAGTTDLETAVPVFTMTIPASTVLPMGATLWRIGNVEINGEYFVRPDKVRVVTTHDDFKDSAYNDGMSAVDKAKHSITFTVLDSSSGSDIESANKYYFQDGGTSKQVHFPYAYTTYTSTDYQAGLVSEINETHQVWVSTSDWTGKTAGKYTGSITFEASVQTNDTETDANMYTNTYPAEPTV